MEHALRGASFVQGDMMKKLASALVLASALALGACQQSIVAKENLLTAAGFVISPADTPAKVAAIKSLPANKFVQQTKDGQPVWLYADPTVCKCLYAGNQTAYQNYRQMIFQQNLANEQQMTALMNQEAAWDWGAWGWGGPQPWIW